jgi:hypothetical protein
MGEFPPGGRCAVKVVSDAFGEGTMLRPAEARLFATEPAPIG